MAVFPWLKPWLPYLIASEIRDFNAVDNVNHTLNLAIGFPERNDGKNTYMP